MKKLFLMLSLCFAVVMVSCKETEKKQEEEKETQVEHAADKADIAMNVEYQCPMDCEEGKTYDSEGTCPVCEMHLKKVEKEGEHTHEDGEMHKDHDSEEKHESDEH